MVEQKNVWEYFDLKEKTPHGKNEVFKVKEGNSAITFLSEPRHWFDEVNKLHNLVVDISHEGKEYVWFVKEKQFVFLKGIKALGETISGRKVIVGRIGQRNATRYTFTEVMD